MPIPLPFRTPLFLFSLVLFLGHQLSQKVFHLPLPLADSYLDNLLCMPLLLPGLQWQQRCLLGRPRLSFMEILAATAFVAFASEWLFPRWSPAFTADLWDVVAYLAGAMVFQVVQGEISRMRECENVRM